ncbi:MAG: alkaline phosphatase D family protein, partial [Gaiellaceae bacterium]
ADPSLFLIAGDFYYADIGENNPDRFREQFQRALTRPAQAALYREVPVAYTWDDHDYGPNDADRTAPSREAARAIYRETVPHYELAAGAGDEAIYQAFTMGRVRFLLTNTRSERDPSALPAGDQRSMLGVEQKRWLKEELLAANGTYPVIVWVNSVPWIAEPSPGGDNWSGFAEERAELSNFIADNAIEGIVMVSGDAHMVAIDDGSNSDYSTNGGAAFPVFHAAALDRRGSLKGGPYSEGAFPGSGQFGLFSVEDDGGSRVVVSLRGLNWKGEEIVSHRIELPARVEAADRDR